MSSTPDIPAQEAELARLRDEIDEMKSRSQDDLVSPAPGDLADEEPVATPTDAIGAVNDGAPPSEDSSSD